MRAHVRVGMLSVVGAVAVAVAVAVAPIAAVASTGTTRSGSQSIELEKKGTISARGAAVRIPLTYSCKAGWDGNINVSLVEALGQDLASGYGSKNLTCTGETKSISVYIQANAYQGARPFAVGPASVSATLDSYDPDANACGDMGCPVAGAAQPPSGSSIFTASSTARPAGRTGAPSSAHSDFQGTITLADK